MKYLKKKIREYNPFDENISLNLGDVIYYLTAMSFKREKITKYKIRIRQNLFIH